jgi:hypothetical protein
MTNSEFRMTNQCRMTNDESRAFPFVIGNWSFLRASTFDIRHSGPEGAGYGLSVFFLAGWVASWTNFVTR